MHLITIGNRFKNARINAGFSQKEVSRLSGFISAQALGKYEKDLSIPSNKVLYFLPKLYQVSLDYLLMHVNYRTHEEFTESVLLLNKEAIHILQNIKQREGSLDDLKNFLMKIKEES